MNMADNIELVIKIPKEQYDLILKSDKGAISDFVSKEAMMYVVKNGIPLPEGHGRLKDVDWIDDNCEHHCSDTDGSWCYKWKDIEDAPTIVGADNNLREDLKKAREE